jgi:O-acetyl-ADP-ribose deacetylase
MFRTSRLSRVQSRCSSNVRNAMELAKQHRYQSIAFPLIGAGSGGRKAEFVLGWMRQELQSIDFDGVVIIVRYKPIA